MLDEDLQNVKCVISYNSSSTVEALFNGINVINLSRKQPCFSGASNKISDIENLNELDREDFKNILFYIGKVMNWTVVKKKISL